MAIYMPSAPTLPLSVGLAVCLSACLPVLARYYPRGSGFERQAACLTALR